MKSKYAGKCLKDESHTWNVDDEIFISKGQDGKWIMCTNKECYISQGGKVSDGKPKFQVNKFPICEAIPIYNLTEELLKLFKTNRQNATIPIEQEIVFVESIFRTLSGNFKP